MQDEAIYRCTGPLCARPLPRRVSFCPYCGTAQPGAADARRIHSAAAAPQPLADDNQRLPVVPAHAGTHAESPGTANAGHIPERFRNPAPHPPSAAPTSAPIGTGWGASAQRPASPQPAQPAASTSTAGPPPTGAARPPRREPIRLRWWLLALAALWAVWFLAKPSSKRVDSRIDRAIALAEECKPREAQSELIALRATSATPEQLRQVQQALNDAATECRRQRQRSKLRTGAGQGERPLAAVDGVARPGTASGHPLAGDTP
ncbi:MAG: hypothetical protein ACJ8LG_19120 [Massilia sp.]